MSNSEHDHPRIASELMPQIERLAPSRVTVLIRGESVAARAAVARALHDGSSRRFEAFIALDCRETESDVLERCLFGGPVDAPSTRGIVHGAERGTLYIDGIELLPLRLQPRLLHFLDGPRALRVVTATATDLALAVREGRFRRDLGERLTLVELQVTD